MNKAKIKKYAKKVMEDHKKVKVKIIKLAKHIKGLVIKSKPKIIKKTKKRSPRSRK